MKSDIFRAMKLKYRGIEYTPALFDCEMVETGWVGTYRGQVVRFRIPVVVPPQTSLPLKYRGIAYQTNRVGLAERGGAAPTSAPLSARVELSTVAAKRHSVLEEVGRVHRENIYRRLVHRLEVAQEKGDQVLIQQLEAELHQFA